MKTSSKIAIAAAAVGAWLIAKKKGVSGIGAVRKKKYKLMHRVTDGPQMLANALRYATEPKIVFNYQNREPIEFEFTHFNVPRNGLDIERAFGQYFKPHDFAGVDVYERIGNTNTAVGEVWNLRELVSECAKIAEELQTNYKQVDYPQYRWSQISFYTDPFGGTYVNLHYDWNTGVVTNWYGTESAYEVGSKKFLRSLIERELYRELKDRDLDYIYEMVNEEY